MVQCRSTMISLRTAGRGGGDREGDAKMGVQFPDGSKIIFKCITGSHLYGTNTKLSDIDERGVFIPPKEYFLGFSKRIEQVEDKENDIVYWDIRKFIQLAADCNPTMIEVLWVPQEKWFTASPEWELIVANREFFLSKKARWSFAGYAVSQANRIKRHRSWLLNPPKCKPERKTYGLPEDKSLVTGDQIGAFNVLLSTYLEDVKQFHPLQEQIDEMIETKQFIGIVQSHKNMNLELTKHILPVSDNFIELYSREKRYIQAKLEWDKYQNWKKNRNPERAVLEEKYGYDTKHALHLYRLLTEGEELLTNHTITLPRPDVELLMDIRNGRYSYDQLMEMIGDVDLKFDKLYQESTLPKSPDINKLDNLCVNIVETWLRESKTYWKDTGYGLYKSIIKQ